MNYFRNSAHRRLTGNKLVNRSLTRLAIPRDPPQEVFDTITQGETDYFRVRLS